jgi:hypothetical protein
MDKFVGIVTYNREKEFRKVLASVKNLSGVTHYAIKDGPDQNYTPVDGLHQLDVNIGVGRCKNMIINAFLSTEMEHLFIIEDDCHILNKNIFDYCIGFANESGLTHFNWNNSQKNKPVAHVLQYPNYTAYSYRGAEGSFSYFRREFVEEIQYDANYINAWEHIDLEIEGHKKGFLPPFWDFVSPEMLDSMLECIDGGESSISHKDQYLQRVASGAEHFKQKWGMYAKDFPFATKAEVVASLKQIRDKYKK